MNPFQYNAPNPFQINQFKIPTNYQEFVATLPPLKKPNMSVGKPQAVAGSAVGTTTPRTITQTPAKAMEQAKPKAPAQPKAPARPKNVIADAEREYQQKLQRELDRAYKAGIGQIEQQTASIQSMQPQFEAQIIRDFEAQIPTVQQQRETALAEARRQYEQGLQRSQQLFGGVAGSSTGQAAADIAAQELLRQQGNIQTQSAQGLQRIELEKQNALLRARDEFRKQLDQINAQRYTIQSQKADAQLKALQDFANRRRNLEDFYTSQQATIEAEQRALANQLTLNAATGAGARKPGTSYLASLGFDDAARRNAIQQFLSLGEGYLARQNLRQAVRGTRRVLEDVNTGEVYDVETGANLTIY